MNRALPGAARHVAAAYLPPALPGLDPAWSRLVEADDAAGVTRTWHVLDTGPALAAAGVAPRGTVVCVHGNPTWSYLWRRLLDAATDRALAGGPAWRVVAVDQLDMGFSDRTGAPRGLAERISDLDAVLGALALDGPAVTLGHDWGGVVSLGWAVEHADRLAAVATLNTAVHPGPSEGRDHVPAPLRLALAPGVLGAGTVTTGAFLETTLALAHPPLAPEVKDAFRAPYRTATERGGIGAFVADIPVPATHQSRDVLERVADGLRALEVPALALWGPRDPVFSDRYLDDLGERLPHLDVHRFEGAGHLVAEDVDYASAVLDWLEVVLEPAADAAPEAGDADAVQPLWHHLDARRDDADVALVEMAPPGGAGPRSVSWRLLTRRVDEIARGLVDLGVRPGDRVSLLVPPGADLTAVLYACLRVGAVVVVADAGLGLRGLTRAVRGARPAFVIGARPGLAAARALGWPGVRVSTTDLPGPLARTLGVRASLADLAERGALLADRADALAHVPAADDVAAVLFTSGSTGPAKGVVYTHRQIAAVRDALAAQYGVGPGASLVAGFAPFALLGPALGTRSVTPDMDVTAPRTLTARALAAAVGAADATVVFLSPAAIANVVATSDALDPADHRALAGVETFLSAGAPVSPALLARVESLMPGALAHTPYGMTESLLVTDVTGPEIRAAAADPARGPGVCVGRPVRSALVRISALDATGAAVGEPSDAPGTTGEVLVAAPHVKDHYDRLWLTEHASRRGRTPTSPRWHRTGDVGHLDAQGHLWIEGRLAHVVVTATGVVTPVGPEQALEASDAVARAAVVGVGPRGAQQLVAVLEPVDPPRRPALADDVLATDARSRTPVPLAAVLVVPDLPTDVRHNSKVDRARLATWADAVLAGGRMVAP
ncbi:acyl-CoA synthetase (AMP-forming)/AMP-acid ligase II [Sediminihabitans luteus]|uniref:Acyl-CoA synthetase (AMP-forming)/AMP-acid ligase II n=1 Tax=Sediminihabitans luteus TaxID=1138585 RepID=A0A2M9CQY5_9CELL|nr:alpha/beta fold hydrolase [Sediminihabitans luteus]PJJ74333.1 acyl-CoA synthetase (AMP-forming)/AMP-acid ligase II [Sediminihabitans luteus]GIJ00445.1 acyl-CoA synthetase [Sediminihabitans luteus]